MLNKGGLMPLAFRRIRRLRAYFPVLLSFALGGLQPAIAAGQVTERAPELWTLEERLAARFDPEKQEKRWHRFEAERRDLGDQSTANISVPRDQRMVHISGVLEPELFFPTQLFNVLIRKGFHTDRDFRESFRERIMNRASSLGFDATLWSTLERISGELIRRNQEESRRAMEINRRLEEASPQERDAIVEKTRKEGAHPQESRAGFEGCRMRFEALAAARRHFGAESFDRLLYRTVAPGIHAAESLTPEQIRSVEAGCP